MRKAVFFFVAFLTANFNFGQGAGLKDIPPKREFRGVWIATVANIDFPSAAGLPGERFEEEWVKTLDVFQQANFNAVIAQMRPAGDAFYGSKIAPWSKYLSGKQGQQPDTEKDPLLFMVQEAHKRNLEFHAWLNPYRAAMDTATANLAATHPFKEHPEWFLRYGGKLYFNPALPEVRNYITEVVMEIVTEYDVDGIHFDDYFYPYPAAGEPFPDTQDFTDYGFGFANIDDWRRNNVDKLISQISQMIKTFAPHVKFGISPFGVWRNDSKDPQFGSPTRAGVNTYDDLYADVRGWLEKGWIDYVAPQLYWNIGFSVADYGLLVDWWGKNSFGRQLYIGQAAYKVNNNPEEAWKKPGEIPRQIRLNRSMPAVNGSIFYNASSTMRNPLGIMDSLRNKYYSAPALPPEMSYLNLPPAKAPTLGKPKYKNGVLSFTCALASDETNAASVVIYRFEDRVPGDFNNARNIFAIKNMGQGNKITIEDKGLEEGKVYTYSASALNRQYTESNLSDWKTVMLKKNRLKKIKWN